MGRQDIWSHTGETYIAGSYPSSSGAWRARGAAVEREVAKDTLTHISSLKRLLCFPGRGPGVETGWGFTSISKHSSGPRVASWPSPSLATQTVGPRRSKKQDEHAYQWSQESWIANSLQLFKQVLFKYLFEERDCVLHGKKQRGKISEKPSASFISLNSSALATPCGGVATQNTP